MDLDLLLEAGKGEQTRLLLRSRLSYAPGFANTLIWRVFTDPISFNMERSMLRGIKVRAESEDSA